MGVVTEAAIRLMRGGFSAAREKRGHKASLSPPTKTEAEWAEATLTPALSLTHSASLSGTALERCRGAAQSGEGVGVQFHASRCAGGLALSFRDLSNNHETHKG
jgi:hypothetical protein